MTLILAVEEPEKNRAVVFCDSGVWRGNSRTAQKEPKAWRSNGWVIGAAGLFSSLHLIRETPLPNLADDESEQEIIQLLARWARGVQSGMAELYRSARDADPKQEGDTPTLVLAHDTRVWGINACSVSRTTDGFDAAGARDFAVAAMFALSEVSGMRAFDRGSLVMNVAVRKTDWAVPPLRWLATDGTEGVL